MPTRSAVTVTERSCKTSPSHSFSTVWGFRRPRRDWSIRYGAWSPWRQASRRFSLIPCGGGAAISSRPSRRSGIRRRSHPKRRYKKEVLRMFKSITFEVIGDQRLVCEGCKERVEHVLKALQGVGQVRAQARNQRVEVLFDAAVLDAAAIAERIDKAGYQTRVVSSTSDSAK